MFSFVKTKNNPILNEVLKYEKQAHYCLKKFKRLNGQEIIDVENKTVESSLFFASNPKEQNSYKLHLNPFIEIIETSINGLNFNPYQYLSQENKDSETTIACLPQVFFEGYKEIELDQIAINILSIIFEEGSSIIFHQLKQKATALFDRTDNDEQAIDALLISKLKYLVGNNLCYIRL